MLKFYLFPIICPWISLFAERDSILFTDTTEASIDKIKLVAFASATVQTLAVLGGIFTGWLFAIGAIHL